MSDTSLPQVTLPRDENAPVADDYRVEVLAPAPGAEVIVEIQMLEQRSVAGVFGAIFAGAITVTE
jgi:hypothetical protein